MKYVSPLTENQIRQLGSIIKNDSSFRARVRAHAVLLSNRGYKMNEIADIFQADRDTVSSWIDLWEQSGFGGLYDNPRSGRPPTLTEDEKKAAEELIRQHPRSPKTVIGKLVQATGKIISVRTLRRIAKGAGLIWKRVRKSLRPKRNVEEFKKAKKEILKLRKRQQAGEIDVYYFDEAGFDTEPSVPYAWQPEGENIGIPSSKSARLNVTGFLNTANNDFHSFTFGCSVNSDIVTACFDWFAEIITRQTVIIVDNAPAHTSERFTENIKKWEEKGLIVRYLPPYSPELNLIEIVWRFMKYHWLPFSAHTSFENLINEVENILRGIGSEYKIDFSPPAESEINLKINLNLIVELCVSH